jgi:hypothetical protein
MLERGDRRAEERRDEVQGHRPMSPRTSATNLMLAVTAGPLTVPALVLAAKSDCALSSENSLFCSPGGSDRKAVIPTGQGSECVWSGEA